MKYIAIAVLVLLLSGCNSFYEDSAREAMVEKGYSDIRFEGMSFFGCFNKAHFNSKFTAKDRAGNTVHGVTCGYGLFGYTVNVK